MPLGSHDPPRPLLGRDEETAALSSLLGTAAGAGRGGALVLLGEPGIGKSALIAGAEADARGQGFVVLRTTGVQAETRLAFSGLHQLLRPVRGHVERLAPALREALEVALGLRDGVPPEHFRVAMAALDMLSEVAVRAPLLVVADDVHWVDPTTSDVLAFVARRLENDPIVLLAAVRDGHQSPLAGVGLPELRVPTLTNSASADLLDASGPLLRHGARRRILREAAGNPLALVELPASDLTVAGDSAVPGLIPLTERLERAFAARVADLRESTRLLLLVAALSDSDDVGDLLAAGSTITGRQLGLVDFEPAAQAAVVVLDERSVGFRHPLMRSAVAQNATAPERRRVHDALAEVLHGEPDRRVWHRAALLTGTHEDVANDLEEAGQRARRRGAISVAVSALRRASELGVAAQRGRRLLGAAQLAFELGQPEVAVPLVREAETLDFGPLEQARAAWIKEMVDLRPFGDRSTAPTLVAAAQGAADAGDHELCIDLLWLVAQRMWWVGAAEDHRKPLVDATRGLPYRDDVRILAILAFADPRGATAEVVRRLQVAAAERTSDIETARHLGGASVVVGAFDTGSAALGVAIEGLREQGRLGHLPRLLALQGMTAARLGDLDLAVAAAEECRRLADELAEPLWGAGAETVLSMVAGMRGDEDAAEEAAMRAELVARPRGARFMTCYAQFGRILAALGAARYTDAYELAERIFDPDDPAHHAVASWHVGDLAEAALHIGHVDHARRRLSEVEATVGDHPGPMAEVSLRHARAVLAEDDDRAEELFQEVVGSDLSHWPFARARGFLTHGQWLRRRRRIVESRTPLRAARDAFDVLGCEAFSRQAQRELRASGEMSRRRDPATRDRLTAQELQIARLAAQGLSNRAIGQRLYLSHRTVGTHLYRTFPKLGITARSELAEALQPS
ncbi:MAG: ATP-binding protein [Dermatophilaceae bacterium]